DLCVSQGLVRHLRLLLGLARGGRGPARGAAGAARRAHGRGVRGVRAGELAARGDEGSGRPTWEMITGEKLPGPRAEEAAEDHDVAGGAEDQATGTEHMGRCLPGRVHQPWAHDEHGQDRCMCAVLVLKVVGGEPDPLKDIQGATEAAAMQYYWAMSTPELPSGGV
ncbi:unnamed protein product, partial [Prorocentrum cordatum]